MKKEFDVAVVGAGPAGLSAAITMARGGLSVIVFERGEFPGSKNVMGGVLYRHATEQLFPEFWKEAPVERRIIEQRLWLLSGDSAVTAGYKSDRFSAEPYNTFTVLRAKFDRWMAKKAAEAGVLIIAETVVEDFLFEGERIVGVRAGRDQGELPCNLVVLCEGVNSLLAQKGGLRKDIPPNHLAVAVKEIVALPKEKIEDRFNLEEGEGATIELVGEATKGLVGTGFIYTNRDSLSVGVGAVLSQVVQAELNPNDLLEGLKQHPLVRRLIAGGESKEYLAHLIPEGGYKAMPALYRDGLMVAGDAAMLVNGIHREGSNLAMTSGRLAGEVALEAHRRGDFSANTLKLYADRLNESFVMEDLKKYRNATTFFEENRQFFAIYPQVFNDMAHEFTRVDSIPKRVKQKKMLERLTAGRPLWQVGIDLWRAWRSLG